MSDLRTTWAGFVEGADLALDSSGLALAVDGGLETAVILSLFTDRRAEPGDVLPDGGGDRRGWWGDLVPLAGYPLGSRLWLLAREKQLPSVLVLAQGYAEEALGWLVESGAGSRVVVEATNPRTGVLALAVLVEAPGAGTTTFQFSWEWMRNAF